MKKTLKQITIAFLMLINFYAVNAQVERLIPSNEIGECGTSSEGPVFRVNQSQLNSSKFAINLTNYVFNVKVHYIANNVATNEQELKALDLVGALNFYYNQANIYFKYSGYNNNSDTSYLNISTSNIGNLYPNNNNRIDIFICNTINGGTGTAGVTYSWANGNTFSKKVIVLRKELMPLFTSTNPTIAEFQYYTAIHEMGHYLGLYHTHQQWEFNNLTNQYQTVNDALCGLEENYNNSQSNILGDLIQDTSPDRVTAKYLPSGTAAYFTNCTLNTTAFLPNTACATSINLTQFNPPMNNIMAYYHYCRTGFSNGQRDFMRAFIDANTNGSFLTNQLNNNGINSLYEPFAIVGVGGSQGGTSTTAYSRTFTPNSTNTGANVWTCPNYTLRFQKGLTYEFSNSTIGTLIKTPNQQYNYSINNHLINVKIPSLNQDIFQFGGINCFASFEPYIKGDVKSLTNLGSSIIMYETLDEVKASDPNLYELLQSQEYHIITKETESGFIDQKVIFKN